MGGFFLIIATIQRESLFIKKLKCEFMFCVGVEHEKMSNPATMKYRLTLPEHIAEKRRAGETAEILMLRSTNAELKKRNRSLKSSLVATREDLTLARTTNFGLTIQLKELDADKVIKEMASLRKNIEELEAKNADLEAKNAAFERQVKRLVDNRLQMMCDLERAQDDLAKAEDVLATTLEELDGKKTPQGKVCLDDDKYHELLLELNTCKKQLREAEREREVWWGEGDKPTPDAIALVAKLEKEVFHLKYRLDIEEGRHEDWKVARKVYDRDKERLREEVKRLKQLVADAEGVNKQWGVWATRLQEVLVERGVTTKDEFDEAVKQLSGEVANDLDGDYVRV